MAFLPSTRARLATSVVLRASKARTDIEASAAPTSTLDLSALSNANIVLGRILDATGRVDIKQTRTNHRIYSLGKNAFEPYRIVPGPIKTDLLLKRVELYARDFLEALGFTQGDLYNQVYPFVIDLELQSPNGATRTIRFHDCWVDANTTPIDMTDDPLVTQDISVSCGAVTANTAVFGGTGAVVNRIS